MSCCVTGVPFFDKCITKDNYKVKQNPTNNYVNNKYLGTKTFTKKLKTLINLNVFFKTHNEAKEAYDFLRENQCYFTINLPIWGEVDFVEVKLLNFDKLERSNFRGGTSSIQLELELLSDENTRYMTDLNGDYIVFDNKLVREQE